MGPNCRCGSDEATLHYKGLVGGVGVGSFPGAGQGGLKEAVKGPRNGISNVSLPLKHGGKKHLLCIFHSPAPHLSFKLSGRATRFPEAHIFSGREVVSQARRVRRT